MTTFKILTFFIFFTLSISNVFANSSTSSYLKNEINEAHKAYLFNDTATGLYALNSLARLLKYIGPDEFSIEGTNLNLALTYFRIGLAPNSKEILTSDFRTLVDKLDKNFSE